MQLKTAHFWEIHRGRHLRRQFQSGRASNEIRAAFANKRLEINWLVPAGSPGKGFVYHPDEEPLQARALHVDGIADDVQEIELSFPATMAYRH